MFSIFGMRYAREVKFICFQNVANGASAGGDARHQRWVAQNIQCIKNAEIVKISLAHTGGILISWKILNPLICCFIVVCFFVSRFLLEWPLFGSFGCEKPQRSQYRSFLAKHFQFF